MKTFAKLFMMVAALVAVSCTIDATEDLGVQLGGGANQTALTLSLEESRTELGEKTDGVYPLYWSEGDKVAVNGVASAALTADQANGAAAVFTFNGELAHPYNLVYPAPAEGVAALTDGQYPVTFPAAQHYTAGTFQSGTAPMYGYAVAPAEGEEAPATQMHHLAGALRFAVKGSKTLTSMTVVAESGKIAGNFDVNCETGALTAHEDASNTITMSFGEGLALGAEATPIYVAVPAGEHGIYTITLFTDEAENNAMVVRFNSDNHPVNAGVVKEFGEITFLANATAEPVSGELVIENEADLVRLAKMSEVGLLGSVTSVRVAATLDMSNVEGWHGIDRFPAINFDGGSDKGYEIKGLKAPLFNTINGGTIKNVKLDVNITVEEGAIFGALANVVRSTAEQVAVVDNCVTSGKLVVATTYKGTTTDDFEIAMSPMIGQAYGATVTNCANNASIEIKAISAATTTQIKPCVGGVVAYVGAGEEGAAAPVLKNCVNNESAKISWNETVANTKLNPYIGGVVGGFLTDGCVENLTNYADIEVLTNMYVPNLGGVCGYLYPSAATYCYNHGDITIDSATSFAYWGGVFGSIYSQTMTITSCENHGDVTFGENASCASRNYIGGVIGTSQSQGAVYSKLKNTGTIANYGKNENTRFFMGGIIGYGWKVGLLDECVNGEQGTNKGAIIVTNELGLADTKYYPSIGGICGCFYPSAGEYTIKNSVNYAPVTVSATIVSVMQPIIGGVVGWARSVKLSDCDNYGAINCDGIKNSAKLPLFIGGVCGFQQGSKGAIDGCDNSGAITLGEEADGVLQLGGVVGYGTHSVTNCSNSGKITIKGSPSVADTSVGKVQGSRTDRDYANRSNVGGVAGKIYSETASLATSYSSLKNTGEIYMPQADSLKCIAIGGVLGEVTIASATMSNVENSGAIKIENATNKGMYVFIGGILGRNFNDKLSSQSITISSWNNSGDISVAETSGIRHTRAGGLIGDLMSAGSSKFEVIISMTNSQNSGDICRVTKAKGSSQSFAGGLVGGVGASMTSANESHMGTDITISGCENSGDVQFDQYDGEKSLDNTAYCNASGGIIGMVYGGLTNTPARQYVPTIKGCTNKGTISAHAGAVGGIVGIIRDWCKIEGTESACNVNEGEVKLLGTVNGYAGGIVGHIYEEDHENCNISVVYSNNKGAVSGTQYVGGIVGASSSTIATAVANCVNVGNVSGTITSGTSSAKYAGYVGGIAGSVAANITSSKSYCDVEALYYANVGGITGSARADAVLAQSCQLGGTVACEIIITEDPNGNEVESAAKVTIVENNYIDYIYGAAVTWAEGSDYDGCSFLSVKPTI